MASSARQSSLCEMENARPALEHPAMAWQTADAGRENVQGFGLVGWGFVAPEHWNWMKRAIG
jgi:hypothetical protein